MKWRSSPGCLDRRMLFSVVDCLFENPERDQESSKKSRNPFKKKRAWQTEEKSRKKSDLALEHTSLNVTPPQQKQTDIPIEPEPKKKRKHCFLSGANKNRNRNTQKRRVLRLFKRSRRKGSRKRKRDGSGKKTRKESKRRLLRNKQQA